jgi:signal transduction histidine kinase
VSRAELFDRGFPRSFLIVEELTEELRASEKAAYGKLIRLMSHEVNNLRGAGALAARFLPRLPPERRPCDVRQLLNEIVLLWRPELERRRIHCEWEVAEPVPPVELDRNQIEQVLVNVLKNAMEAIGEDGRITLRLAIEGKRPVPRIADSGPGFPEEVRPLLFTPFFSTKRDGRGLGLTLTREILASHGFDFGLENRPEGGAELWVGFPTLL